MFMSIFRILDLDEYIEEYQANSAILKTSGAFVQLSNSAAERAPNCLAAMQQRSENSSCRCRTAAAAVPRFSSRALPRRCHIGSGHGSGFVR